MHCMGPLGTYHSRHLVCRNGRVHAWGNLCNHGWQAWYGHIVRLGTGLKGTPIEGST